MQLISFEQAIYHRPDRIEPRLVAISQGFKVAWQSEVVALIHGFGDRPSGVECPLAVFAKPLGKDHVAIVRVKDETPEVLASGLKLRGLMFHFLVVDRALYEAWICDPFILAEKIPPVWNSAELLPTITLPTDAFHARTLAQVQAVLKRVKASGLREGEDPDAPDFERTADNSESPALLGGAQILVDGGRLVFERPAGDLRMVSGLWLLLPEMTRIRRWPTSFAFSQDLGFDVLVVPKLDDMILESYTTEEQAADYPDGAYELALQRAAENGEQGDLDEVFRRRDGNQTLRIGIALFVVMSLLVLVSRWLTPAPLPPPPLKVLTAATIVSICDPIPAATMVLYWDYREKNKE